MSDDAAKCAVCGEKLAKGERRVCRRCVVDFARLRAERDPSGGGLWKLKKGARK